MVDSLEIKLETLAPIWIGGLDGKSDQLHMTGILGSLRRWYEVLVRSVGGNACAPTTHSCIYTLKMVYVLFWHNWLSAMF